MNEIHIHAWGRVQGVFFRRATQRAATRLGLKGFVRNCEDGGVEICYLGEKTKATDLLSAIEKSNPLVRIDRKEIHVQNNSENFDSFEIRIQDAI